MLLLATFMLGAFVFGAVLQDDVDDDDDNGPSNGIMIPLQIPAQNLRNSLHIVESFFIMPRGQINKDEMKCHVLKLKHQIDSDDAFPGEKDIAQKYLNLVLDKIDEYRSQGLTGSVSSGYTK